MNKKGQNISEYAIIIGLVGSAILMMGVYFQRGIKAVIKEPADNLGGFGTGVFTAQQIQEIGIEDNVPLVEGEPTILQPYWGRSTVNSTKTVTITPGGQHQTVTNENITTPIRSSEVFGRIKFDQITQPNVSDHNY